MLAGNETEACLPFALKLIVDGKYAPTKTATAKIANLLKE
jgi:hypothetical protein